MAMSQATARARGKKVRVLVVDDSALVRKLLCEGLAKDPRIEVVGGAADPYAAREMMVKLRPDVLTLDVEMPKMDGVTFLRHMMAHLPTPVVMVSSLTGAGKQITVDALSAGAVDVVCKPKGIVDGLPKMMIDLQQKVVAASRARVKKRDPSAEPTARAVKVAPAALAESSDKIIAIGSSTGGVEALARIIPCFPAASPGVVVVQHMPAGFTASFAKRLDGLGPMEVREAEDGDRVRPGLVLIAPGGERHLRVERAGGQYRVKLEAGPTVAGHCPSVDVMFGSVAQAAAANATAALLTGMGRDGAQGLLEMRKAGAKTFAQDEATSVIWGMPGAAWKVGAAEKLLPLDRVVPTLLASVVQRFSSF